MTQFCECARICLESENICHVRSMRLERRAAHYGTRACCKKNMAAPTNGQATEVTLRHLGSAAISGNS
jgi:hypothetical protein